MSFRYRWYLAIGLVVLGCGSNVDGTSTGSTGAGGSGGGGCPATLPSGSCDEPGLTCDYVDGDGCPSRVVCFEYLDSASWDSRVPPPGGPCSMAGQICTDTVSVGDNPPEYAALECGASSTWQVHDLCPATAPAPGSACDYPYMWCSYDVCAEPGSETRASCMGTWTIHTTCP